MGNLVNPRCYIVVAKTSQFATRHYPNDRPISTNFALAAKSGTQDYYRTSEDYLMTLEEARRAVASRARNWPDNTYTILKVEEVS